MTSFNGATSNTLRVLTSTLADPTTWVESQASYTSVSGVVRDPSPWYSVGSWYVCHTDHVTTTTTFEIAISTDGLTYSHLATPSFGSDPSGVNTIWAPSRFLDGSGNEWFAVCAGTGGQATDIFITKPNTPGNYAGSWANLTHITITGRTGGPLLDPVILPPSKAVLAGNRGANYELWYTYNVGGEYTEVAVCPTLTGTYTVQQSGSSWAGFGAGVEGTAIYQPAVGTAYVLLDNFSSAGYKYSITANGGASFSSLVTLNALYGSSGGTTGLNGVLRHGGVVTIPQQPVNDRMGPATTGAGLLALRSLNAGARMHPPDPSYGVGRYAREPLLHVKERSLEPAERNGRHRNRHCKRRRAAKQPLRQRPFSHDER